MAILAESDISVRRIPRLVAVGPRPGPVIWLTGGVHGDEVTGIVVIHELFKRLRRRPLLCGEVHGFPLLNPMGFETHSRNVPLSGEDLNRSFPGSATGSLAERIADRVFRTILATGPALAIDLHSDWRHSIPYTVLDAFVGTRHRKAYAEARAAGRKIGLLSLRERPSEAARFRGALSWALLRSDVPALTIELGESDVVNEANVDRGVRGLWNLLGDYGLTDKDPMRYQQTVPPEYRGRILHYTEEPRSPRAGIVRFLVKPGDVVTRGTPIGRVYDLLGKARHTLRAEHDGVVLGHADASVTHPGFPVMAFATLDS
jgi:predicted deacylase